MVTGFKYFPEVHYGPTRFAKIHRYAYLQFQAEHHITQCEMLIQYATMRYIENLFGELT